MPPLSAKLLKRQIIELARATEPVPARCQHASECGGCAIQDRAYAAQVAAKQQAFADIWRDIVPDMVASGFAVVPSPDAFNYRTRMDYVASKGRFGLRRGGKFNHIIDLQECHLIPPFAFDVARAVYTKAMELGLPDYHVITHEGFLRYVVVRRSPADTLLLALVTSSREHAAEMQQIAAFALTQPGVVGVHWLLNDKLTDLSLGDSLAHWGSELLPMPVGNRVLDIGPNTFFQNNVHLLLPLLDAVRAHVGPARRVADLYGGVGTIALHLADGVGEVVSVEEWPESAALASQNSARNGAGNVQAIAADTLAYLREQPAGAFDVVVVDPPRIGLGPEVCRELLRLAPERLVYVSCNPLTQADDTRILAEGYTMTHLSGYDMFPHTPHLEGLSVYERI